jgi:hypothetical protein
MQFSIIYSADCPSDHNIERFAPPKVEELWDPTEGDDQYGYSYLEGRWLKGHPCASISITRQSASPRSMQMRP